MSEITLACPHCPRQFACDEIHSGEQINCPGCGKPLNVPPPAVKGLGLGDFLKKALPIIATVIGLGLVVLAILFAACAAMLQHV